MKSPTYPDTHHDVSSNTIFGFWIYLMTDCIMFATFFAAYAVLYRGADGGGSPRELLSLPSALVETILLLTSSFTCGISLVQAPQSSIRKILSWLAVSFALGVAFLALQSLEFQRLIDAGNTWQKNAFLSSYFTLLGVHGLHIVVGLIWMIVFSIQLFYRGITSVILRRLTCFRIYWQFLYFIWIFTFAIVYLIGAK